MSSLMQRSNAGKQLNELWTDDEELGQLLRWSLATSIGNAEPSPEVWRAILERVGERRAPGSAQHTSRPSTAPLTALVQTALIGCVVMTLGLGVRRDAIIARNNLAVSTAPATESHIRQEQPKERLVGSPLSTSGEEQPHRIGGMIQEATLPG